MRKVISHQTSVIRLFLIFISLTTYYLLLTTSTIAVDSTQSARLDASIESQRASPSASRFEQFQKEILEKVASKAANLKAEVSGRLLNKAYIGKIKSKTDDLLILTNGENDKTIKFNQFTEYMIPIKTSKTKPTIKNLEVENYVVALGDIDETEVLIAKKIIRIEAPTEIKQIYFGKVLAINENMITLKTDQNLAVSTNAQTNFKIGQKDGTLDNIKIGQKVIVSGISKNNIIKANLIYIFN